MEQGCHSQVHIPIELGLQETTGRDCNHPGRKADGHKGKMNQNLHQASLLCGPRNIPSSSEQHIQEILSQQNSTGRGKEVQQLLVIPGRTNTFTKPSHLEKEEAFGSLGHREKPKPQQLSAMASSCLAPWPQTRPHTLSSQPNSYCNSLSYRVISHLSPCLPQDQEILISLWNTQVLFSAQEQIFETRPLSGQISLFLLSHESSEESQLSHS